MELQFKVTSQHISLIDDNYVVAGSKNYLYTLLNLGDDWNNEEVEDV